MPKDGARFINHLRYIDSESRTKLQNDPETFEQIELCSNRWPGDHRTATSHSEIHIDFSGFQP
jgi:hypothetical protein